MKFSKRDYVRVRQGFVDDETGTDMSGWQGRIKELYPDEGTAMVSFDSITLRAIPDAYIESCEEGGFGWTEYGYEVESIEIAKQRDRPSDVLKAIAERVSTHQYSHLGEEGRDMDKILAGVKPGDEMGAFEAWNNYLSEKLTFPIDASVNESSSRSPIRVGDRVRIHGIEMVDDHYGIIVKIKRGKETFHHPLCDLAVIDPNSPYHDPIQLYAVWFANR